MNYEQALEYLQLIDTVLYSDEKFEQALSKAKDALQDCLELGLTGAQQGEQEPEYHPRGQF